MKRKKDERYENLPMIDKLPIWCNLAKELEKLKVNIGIDKLKLCYTVVNEDVINYLETEKPDFLNLYEFDLQRIEGKYHSDIYQILVKDVDNYNIDKEIETVVFGELRFNLKAENENEVENNELEKEKRVWLYINNETLYKKFLMNFLDYIVENLGLRLRNVTEIEIYIDSTKKNIPQLLKRMVRCSDFKMILNGKEIKDREEYRPELDYNHSGNCNKYTNLTFYASSQKAKKNKRDGITVCAYDKKTEVDLISKKHYILEKYKKPKKLYRTEIRVGNEKFKEYCIANRIELEEFIFRDKGFLYATFEWFFEKVLYFKNELNKKLSVAEIIL